MYKGMRCHKAANQIKAVQDAMNKAGKGLSNADQID
jgi:DNA-binding FrmR family transcriptional regulator